MRKQWTDQLVVTELAAIIAGSGKMPSVSDLGAAGRNDLAIQVSRRGGFIAWAERMGASRTISDSDTGWSGEIRLAQKLEEDGFRVSRMAAVKAPWDLEVNSCLRVDVKSAKYAEYGASKGWFYRVGKRSQADVLAFYQLDTGVCYFVPWMLCPASNVTISRSGGKYAEFRDRFDILEKLCSARNNEILLWPGFKYHE